MSDMPFMNVTRRLDARDNLIGVLEKEIVRLQEQNDLYRKTLEIIAGQPQCVLEAMQAKAALDNIGPPLPNGDRQ